jgi:RNA polymerase sigma factor (sigma-70 family)
MRLSLRVHTDAAAVEQSAEDAALMRMEMERIVASISALPPDQRAVVVLRDVHGLSGGATADALGLSRAAMKSRLHRGREALHAQLEETPAAADGGARRIER